ncbi:hypothetical protein [Enterovibrio norvegicus]|uniref:hypothetical protein n=1 Tax=Enterovibrio norvegicus TaxID=188144 RepID=UPI0010544B17|nr:hypothetical protein [Enterovibrio norvegicus]
MNELRLTISSENLSHKGRLTLIKRRLESTSNQKTTYEFSVSNNQLTVTPDFKTEVALNRVKESIWEILNDQCEELDNSGHGCSDNYNCCDCGGHNCGCAYCFSCHACPHCLDE